MNIHKYRRKALKKHSKILDFFLLLLLSLSITSLIFVGLSESALNHFESRTGNISVEISSFLFENAEDVVGIMEGQNLCNSFDFSQLSEQERVALQMQCDSGPITIEDLPSDVLDKQVASFTQQVQGEIKEKLDYQIASKRDFFEKIQHKFPFLRMYALNIIIAVLLLVYLFNNDLVILLNYLSKKLMILVPLLFIIPYLLFRLNILSSFIDPSSFQNMFGSPVAINMELVVSKAVELVSDEMVLFYSKFWSYALLALLVGVALWYYNKHFLMPNFATKHNLTLDKKK